jgi:hypothetical protein
MIVSFQKRIDRFTDDSCIEAQFQYSKRRDPFEHFFVISRHDESRHDELHQEIVRYVKAEIRGR